MAAPIEAHGARRTAHRANGGTAPTAANGGTAHGANGGERRHGAEDWNGGTSADGGTGANDGLRPHRADGRRVHIFQTCIVHMVRSSTRLMPWTDRRQACADLREIYTAPDEQHALRALDRFSTRSLGTFSRCRLPHRAAVGAVPPLAPCAVRPGARTCKLPYSSAAMKHSVRSLLLASLACLSLRCLPRGDPAVGDGFKDDFERADVGPAYRDTGGSYHISNGQLRVQGAKNHPLWLRRTLPRDVRVEFDVRSESPEGDIKVEIFGDGFSKATEASYTATSYVVIFGGWNNSKNVIARMNEHGADRAEGKRNPVVKGRTYHMKIERKGDTISAWADDQLLAQLKDDSPLRGRGHEYFAFNNWQAELWFDNLKITPL